MTPACDPKQRLVFITDILPIEFVTICIFLIVVATICITPIQSVTFRIILIESVTSRIILIESVTRLYTWIPEVDLQLSQGKSKKA